MPLGIDNSYLLKYDKGKSGTPRTLNVVGPPDTDWGVQSPYTANYVQNTDSASNNSIYWVHRSTGNDSTGDGSEDSPYLTIQAAMTAVISGTINRYIGILDDGPILNLDEFTDSSTGLGNSFISGLVRMEPNLVAETRTTSGGATFGNNLMDEYDGANAFYTFDLCKIEVAGHTIYLRRSIQTPFTSSTVGSYIEWSPTGNTAHGNDWVRMSTSATTTAYYGSTYSTLTDPVRYEVPQLPSTFSFLTDTAVITSRRGANCRLHQIGNEVYIFGASANGKEVYKIKGNPNFDTDSVCWAAGKTSTESILVFEQVYNVAAPLVNDSAGVGNTDPNRYTNATNGLAGIGYDIKPTQLSPGQIDGKNAILFNGTIYLYTDSFTSQNEIDSPSLIVIRTDNNSIMGLENVGYPSGYQNPKTAVMYYTTDYESWVSTGSIEDIFGDHTSMKLWDFAYIGGYYYLLAADNTNKTIEVARYNPSSNTWTVAAVSGINASLAMNVIGANLLEVYGYPVIAFSGNVNGATSATNIIPMSVGSFAFSLDNIYHIYDRYSASSAVEYYKGRFHVNAAEYSCSLAITNYSKSIINSYVTSFAGSYARNCNVFYNASTSGFNNIYENSMIMSSPPLYSYFKSYNVTRSQPNFSTYGLQPPNQGKTFFCLFGLYNGSGASLVNGHAEKLKIQHDAGSTATANLDLVITSCIIEDAVFANPAESNKGYIDTIKIKDSFIKSTSTDGLVIESDGTTNDVVIQFTTIEAKKIKFDYGTSGALLNAYLENNIWKVDDITYTPTSGNDVVIDYALFTGGISGTAPYVTFGNNTIYRDPLFRNDYGELQRKIYGDYVESPAIRASSELNLVTGSRRDLGAYNVDDSLVIETYRTSVYLPKPPGNSIEMREVPTTSTHIAISGSPDVTNDPNKKTEYLTITYENVTDDVYQVFREIETSLFDMTVYLALDPNYLTDTPSITTSQAASIGDVEIYIVPTAIYAGSRLNIGGVDYYIRYKVNNNNNLTARVVLDMPLKTAISNATVIELTHPVGNGEYEYIPQERRFKRADSADMDVKGSFQVVFARKAL